MAGWTADGTGTLLWKLSPTIRPGARTDQDPLASLSVRFPTTRHILKAVEPLSHTLVSSDGESFVIEEVVARKLQIVRHMIEDECADKAIPLTNVTRKILSMVIEYCKTHVNVVHDEEEISKEGDKEKKEADSRSEEEAVKLKQWEAEFLKDKDLATVFQLILAANYLNVQGLLDLTSQSVADHIKDMTPEEVREIFNIENDYTPEEEEEVRRQNSWAFEEPAAAPKP
ncbi:PREDICTED: SKP1-like protein 14 [Camelina sativa]|uniref:SKP1-like protein 14 n=1 Tax=Camelina sativa TaxID=90675 RepID=A0ABM0USH8_CAMSA|nr:PREDICTED: SKP1-like protein 14 [Camelina sativa]